MKASFFPALALDSMRKNRRLYLPYFFTCAGMVMMQYIITFLQYSQTLSSMQGGANICMMMGFGSFVIALFSLLFLFYTNAFLLRRRKKEFGLYNILGMGKRHISRILLWETLIMAVGSLLTGLAAGIALSKIAELGLIRVLNGDVSFDLSLSVSALLRTAAIFGAIFLLLFLNALRQVRLSGAIQLLRSENTGEKPPRANWAAGILGVVLLAAAYWMAVTIQDPIEAMQMFFIAVLLVIVGTYLLFIAGSVLLCRTLQKKKRYYYRPQHFVSVSSMAYRMKRNGAGLASICILATMVLVIVSTTSSLYFGAEDCLNALYPRQANLTCRMTDADALTDGSIARLRQKTVEDAGNTGMTLRRVVDWRSLSGWGTMDGTRASLQSSQIQVSSTAKFYFVPLEDYNSACGTRYTLQPGEVLLFTSRADHSEDTISFGDACTFRIARRVDTAPPDGDIVQSIVATYMLVLPDLSAVEPLLTAPPPETEDAPLSARWHYSFDTGLPADRQIDAIEGVKSAAEDYLNPESKVAAFQLESREHNRADFLGTYGSFFYLGGILSLVFLAAAVEMIYYKQITEGYEDQARFSIMQKVGMTRREIRRSVNSQLLTVFFLPLAGAGLHLAFAYPMICQLLQLFNLQNRQLFTLVTVISFSVFALFYALVYRLTSNAYYHIVSDRESD